MESKLEELSANIAVFSDDMLVNLRSAALKSERMGFAYNKDGFIGLYAECIIKNKMYVLKVDQDFDSKVNKILYE